MKTLLDLANDLGAVWFRHALAVAWQATVLVAVLAVLDRWLVRRTRAVVRHALWLLVPLKLLLPTQLALPTSPLFWFRGMSPAAGIATPLASARVEETRPGLSANRPSGGAGTVAVEQRAADFVPEPSGIGPAGTATVVAPVAVPGSMRLTPAGGLFAGWLVGVLGLGGAVIWRWSALRRQVRSAEPAGPELLAAAGEAGALLGLRCIPQVGVMDGLASPSVCGLFRPVVLVPKSLVGTLSVARWREVFLHELAHVRRGDLVIGHLWLAVQIAYAWHPLVWWTGNRLREVAEEATDETVVVALGGAADGYASTLVEIARGAVRRQFATLGLLGIVEPRGALTHRVRRLLSGSMPAEARLGARGFVLVAMVAATLLPLSGRTQAPATREASELAPRPVPAAAREANIAADRSETTAGVATNRSAPPPQDFSATSSRAEVTRQGNQALREHLSRIRLPEVSLPNLPLIEVVRWLREQALARDPEGKGINFVINPILDAPPSDAAGIDPATGRAATRAEPPPADLKDALILIDPPLRDVTMYDAIRAVVNASRVPIQYSLEDYGVVFLHRTRTGVPLVTRVFRVNPATFAENLRRIRGFKAGAEDGSGAVIARLYELVGITNEVPRAPSSARALFYNDRVGLLMARLAPDEIEVLEQAMVLVNAAPAQVVMEVLQLDVSAERLKGLGFPDPRADRAGAEADADLTWLLTPPQLRVLLRAVETDRDSSVMAMPRVTTLADRTAEISSEPEKGPPEDRKFPALTVRVTPLVRPDGRTLEVNVHADLHHRTGRHQAISTVAAVPDGGTVVLVSRSGSERGTGRRYFLLVTPTIIDPAGNPVNPPPGNP